MTTALTLSNITAGYGATLALRGVTLDVPPGSVVALIGANGAGKTTTVRVASGMVRPRSGRVLVGGVDFAGAAPHDFADAGICHIPEGRAIFPGLTVRENIRLFSIPGKEAEGFERAYDMFPVLRNKSRQVAGTLSGGEQQMLALSRACTQLVRVALVDEASMGLAPRLVEEVFSFLDRLRRDGVSLLIVEQYVGRVLQVADYVYVLRRGTLDFAGDPSELEQEDVYERYVGRAGEVGRATPVGS